MESAYIRACPNTPTTLSAGCSNSDLVALYPDHSSFMFCHPSSIAHKLNCFDAFQPFEVHLPVSDIALDTLSFPSASTEIVSVIEETIFSPSTSSFGVPDK